MRSDRLALTTTDALLLLMTLIWGANLSVIKVALAEIPPLGFNSLRLAVASVLFLAAIGASARGRRRAAAPVGRRDWLVIAALGITGHTLYQACFMNGLARTTVSNTALIFGCSPVTVGLLSAAAGHERIGALHWSGAALSVTGIYLLVGHGPELSRASLTGDMLVLGALAFWAIYTVGARPLLARYSPLVVTGYSMVFGTLCYVPLGLSDLVALSWTRVSLAAWLGLAFSAVFALFLAYLIWYTAVHRIGNLRTAMYSNITPIVALAIAVVWLGEQMTAWKALGGAAILAGAALTRLVAAPAPVVPVEE